MAGQTENRKVYISINGNEVKNTYRDIRNEVSNLRRQLQNTTRGTKEFEDASRNLRNAEKHFSKVREEVGFTNKSIKQSGSLLKGLGPAIAGAFSIAAVQQLGSQIIDVRSRFERYFAVLKTSLGSARAANKEFEMIKQFAAETPFSVDELTDSFVKLTNQGFKPTREQMRALGDLAASTGKQYDQLAEAIVDAQTGEFERLKEFGIRAKKEGDKVTFTFKEQQTQVDFTSSAIQKYILSLGELQGVSGSMAEISQTLGGRISNLGDAWDTLLFNLGEGKIWKDTVGFLGSILNRVNAWIEVPLSAKLKEQRVELKLLETQLYNTNTSEEKRLGIIRKLQAQYPDYLGNIDAEKISNEDLSTALRKVNGDLLNRITLQMKEEEITKATQKLAEAENDRYTLLQGINEQLILAQGNSYDASQFKNDQDFLDAAEEIIDRYRYAQQGVGASGISSSIPSSVTRLSQLMSQYRLNLNQVTEAEEELKEVQKSREFVEKQLGVTLEEIMGKESEQVTKGKQESAETIKARGDARKKIEEILIKAAGSEEEIIRAKYDKLIELAKKHKIDLVDELTAQMNDELVEAISERAQKEIDEERKAHEKYLKEREALLNEYEILSNEQRLEEELQRLKQAYESDLLSFEEYQQAQDFIRKYYADQQKQREDQSQQEWLRNQQERLAAAQEWVSAFTGLVTSMRDMELSAIEEVRREDFEVQREKGESEEAFQRRREAAEEKYTKAKAEEEQKRREVSRRYAVAEALSSVAQIGINTAEAIMKALAVLGPIAGAVAAGVIGTTGVIQAGVALNNVNQMRGYAEGGITEGLGFKDSTGYQVAGVVHEGEQVIPKWMRQSPRYARTLDALEFARANNLGRYDQGGLVGAPSTTVKTELDSGSFLVAVNRFSEKVDLLIENGLYAVADDDFERAMREKRERDEQIMDNTRL